MSLVIPRLGAIRNWRTSEIGDEAIATIRCSLEIPGGMALGSDYGLTLYQDGVFRSFPWPVGARREARRVEALAMHGGCLYVGTSQNIFRWNFVSPVEGSRHGRDQEDGWDDICCLFSYGDTLFQGFRTRLYGGEGPPDVLCMAADPATGRVFAGTRDGVLFLLGQGVIRRFEQRRYDGRMKGRPIRHLAFADGYLWVAADDTLHRFDGTSWFSRGSEPTAFTVDAKGRLWALAEGKLWYQSGGWLLPVPVPLQRPWCLAARPGELWVGGLEQVWKIDLVD